MYSVCTHTHTHTHTHTIYIYSVCFIIKRVFIYVHVEPQQPARALEGQLGAAARACRRSAPARPPLPRQRMRQKLYSCASKPSKSKYLARDTAPPPRAAGAPATRCPANPSSYLYFCTGKASKLITCLLIGLLHLAQLVLPRRAAPLSLRRVYTL